MTAAEFTKKFQTWAGVAILDGEDILEIVSTRWGFSLREVTMWLRGKSVPPQDMRKRIIYWLSGVTK